MLFSIIVPVYNVEKYVAECIESVIAQTYPDWELILVDDGSTDGSHEICQKYAHQNEKIRLYSKENGGLADSRNYGVQKVSGQYMLFLDSDDFIEEKTLENLYKECMKWNYPDVIMSEGMHEVNGTQMRGYKHWNCSEFQGLTGRETLLKTMKVAPNWSACGKCYRVEFWQAHGFSFAKNRLAEDFELVDKVVLEAQCVSMIPTFYYYRIFRNNSITTKPNKILKEDIIKNFDSWEDYFVQTKVDQELMDAFRKVFVKLYCHDVLGSAYLFKGKEKKDYLKKAKKYSFYLDYAQGKEEKVTALAVRSIGISLTCAFLGVIKRIRIRRDRKMC